MTLKYLAVLDHPEVQRIYRYLHVPVDHYVIEAAAKEKVAHPGGNKAWSRLPRDEYIDYQLRLREIVPSSSCPLDWESTAWIDRT